jgi:hypothetical protein
MTASAFAAAKVMVQSPWSPLKGVSLRDATAQYNAIKSLIAKKQHENAVQRSWQLYDQLCRGCNTTEQRDSSGDNNTACTQGTHLQLGQPSGDACSKQRATLLTGSIMSLIISAVESQRTAVLAETLCALIQPLGVLPAWLRLTMQMSR